MCLGVPVVIDELVGSNAARVTLDGSLMVVSTALIDDARVGDYVIVHAGYAIEKVAPEEAMLALEAIASVIGRPVR